jgi:hypothetical protein
MATPYPVKVSIGFVGIHHCRMATDYRQSAKDARKRSDDAKASLDRHSEDLSQIQNSASDAADRLGDSTKCHRKREADRKRRRA